MKIKLNGEDCRKALENFLRLRNYAPIEGARIVAKTFGFVVNAEVEVNPNLDDPAFLKSQIEWHEAQMIFHNDRMSELQARQMRSGTPPKPK